MVNYFPNNFLLPSFVEKQLMVIMVKISVCSDMVSNYVKMTNSIFGSTEPEKTELEDEAPPAKRPKLLASYSGKQSAQPSCSHMQQLNKYLSLECDVDDCLLFWERNKSQLDKLFMPAMRALSIPASSSAVERVFSQGGLILRPHRARMSDKLLSELIFLKCN